MAYNKLFKQKKAFIGMIHVPALPGTPNSTLSMQQIIAKTVKEAEMLIDVGVHGIIIENMHDRPYIKPKDNHFISPEVTAAMTVVTHEIRQIAQVPLGVQVLAAANKEALAIAQITNADFVRVEGFVFGHVADEGWIEACAGELLRYRKMLGAEDKLIFADIKKKHAAHNVTADVSIEETANAAEFFMADGLIITGSATAKPVNMQELKAIAKITELPIIIGSGITINNLERYLPYADCFIIGSALKKQGLWCNELDINQLKLFKSKFDEANN